MDWMVFTEEIWPEPYASSDSDPPPSSGDSKGLEEEVMERALLIGDS